MKILEVYLEGYRRLKLNKVNSIKLVASELIQLLIGTNGSGKSSLQEQINCWVADRKDFKVGGCKIVKMEHNNTKYETRQFFNKKNSSFEFIVDGENINEGETGAVQKDLIKFHFGLDGDLMDLLLGKVRFTRMNPTQRREILTKISGLDLTYAIGLHKRIASAGRDVTGAKKLLDKRMVNETANVWKDEDWEQWTGIQDRLSGTLTQLMRYSNPSAGDFRDLDRKYSDQVARMKNLTDKHMDEYMGFEPLLIESRGIYSLLDYQNNLSELNGNKQGLAQNRDMVMSELEELQTELEDLQKYESIDAAKWGRLKASSEEELVTLTAKTSRFNWTSYDPTYNAVLTEASSILSEFLHLKTSTDFDPVIGRAVYEQESVELENLKKHYNNIENTLDKVRHRVRDIEEAKTEACPKCSYVFIPGVSEKELVTLKENAKRGSASLIDTKKRIDELTERTSNFEVCLNNDQDFRNIINGFMMFRGVWKEVIADDVLLSNPQNILFYLSDAEDDLVDLGRAGELRSTIMDAERKLIKAGESSNVSGRLESIGKREVGLTTKLNNAVRALEELEKTRAYLQSNYKRADFVTRAEEVINKLLTDYEILFEERLEAMKEVKLQEDIRIHQQKLATVTKTISEQETKRGILTDLQKQSGQLEEDAELWRLLNVALSPTSGLIAEQLLGFMHKFTESLNGIIDKIWTHDLIIMPCKGTGENLDYKFPLYVDGDDEPNGDISMSSTGQLDVIDFAFRLVAMSYLGMEDYPLYTDELGSSFDEEHKENLQKFLKLLIDSSNCSQLWIISHAYAVQNSLGACETCVVDKSNITVPVKYNEHVEFG
jgi:DNA repair exonuclease SbcCD ATPase subunit